MIHKAQARPLGGARPALALAAALLGCVARQYALPMTASELRGYPEPEGLVAYLSQPAATAAVCEPGPGCAARLDAPTRKALARALRDGALPPARWRACMAGLLRGAAPAEARAALEAVLEDAVDALGAKGFETDRAAQGRADALAGLYADRDPALPPPAEAARDAAAALRKLVASPRTGPAAGMRAADLHLVLELEQGRLGDQPLDAAELDRLAATGDEATLRRATARLPDPILRDEARRRIVALRVQASPHPEVRGDAAAVEERVLRTGANALDLARHPPVDGALDAARAPRGAVLVEQQLPAQTARLLGAASAGGTPSVLPEVPLRGLLLVAVRGIRAPVTVCAPAEALDPSPCIAPGDLQVDPARARVDGAGVLHVSDVLTEPAAVEQAAGGRLSIPLTAGGRVVARLEWPARFARPADLVLTGARPGADGPELEVTVDGRDPARLLYAVRDGARVYRAAVERADARDFHVVSRGAAGEGGVPGRDASDGASGSDGMGATCPSFSGQDGGAGGDGADGEDGGPGGPGGRGGDVRILLTPAPGLEDELAGLVRFMVLSQGGAGGPGGSGGRGGAGGRGGRGGSGTTCPDLDGSTTRLSGGMDGRSGRDGLAGHDGPDGLPGRPGTVTIELR